MTVEPRPLRDEDPLAAAFFSHRSRLRAIAHRVLGSQWDAEDVVQEAWLRLRGADVATIDNLEAWLTVVVSRLSVDLLRSRGARREDLDADLPEAPHEAEIHGPEAAALHADEVSAALLVVLESLTPLERLAFVLHDVFGLSFDDVAPIVERTPAATRQLASRARRSVRAVDVSSERSRRVEAVEAFLKASREGDFGALLRLLDPDIELRTDDYAFALAAPHAAEGAPLLERRLRGADAVARAFAGRARDAVVAIVDGLAGAAYAPAGTPVAIYTIAFRGGAISRIDVIGEPGLLSELNTQLARS